MTQWPSPHFSTSLSSLCRFNRRQELVDRCERFVVLADFDPVVLFSRFVGQLGFSSSVLLDFLISSETIFLEYLTKYESSRVWLGSTVGVFAASHTLE